MPTLPLRDVARIARSLGHRDLNVAATKRGFVATCSCGYKSAIRRTDVQAAQAAAHHLELIANAWQASGRTIPKTSQSNTPLLEDNSESPTLRLV